MEKSPKKKVIRKRKKGDDDEEDDGYNAVKAKVKKITKAPTKKLKTDSLELKTKKLIKKISATKGVAAVLQEDVHNNIEMWDEIEMLSFVENIPKSLAKSFITLLSEGCTLPFIARYRKGMVDNLMPDRLQELADSFQSVRQLKMKVKAVISSLRKSKKLTPEIKKSLLNAKNLSEVEFVYAPLKSQYFTLAERARNLGLEPPALNALQGQFLDVHSLCKSNIDELSTVEKVDTHLTHLVADIIYRDTRVMEEIRKLKEQTRFTIQSHIRKAIQKKTDGVKRNDTKSDPETYKLYFNWQCPNIFVKPHQTLAINRGEDEKILTVNVIVPDWFYKQLERFCLTLWRSHTYVRKGLTDAYNRLIKPWLSRKVRSDLTLLAEKEAVKTFTSNLEKYLLTEPIKNRRILGLDPGFKAGCKVGIVDADGKQLEVCTLYPNLRKNNNIDSAALQLKGLIEKYNVELIGLGNGTACRETESWLKHHGISRATPVIIVPEQGASIYSISKEAQKEHPNMDPNLISALSIARRVLDPLGELIKVDPKNLGVGMYQHDLPPKMLETALDCTVEKIVSLVGADVNTASVALLRRIAGLNENRANKLIKYRQENGGFKTREELMKITGIGKITYQQCAGFLKILNGLEPLDATIIHPESYTVAKALATKLGVNTRDLTMPQFSQIIENKVLTIDKEAVIRDLNIDISTLDLILTAFKQKAAEDNLITFSKPVYSLAVQATEQLREGMTLTGVVRNVVPFGCFVDCGVGDNGLIHRSNLAGNRTPKLGDRVSVTILASPKPKRIQMRLEKILD